MHGFIYITTNLINGKKYLGMCSYHKPNHKSYLGSGKALQRAITKYGKENFTREVIEECLTKQELSEKEIYYIEHFNAVNDSSWYNIASGGYTTRGFSGKTHSEETKSLMRKNHKQNLTEDSLKRIGHAVKQRWQNGEQTTHQNHAKGSHHGRARPVTINGIQYDTITEARNATGLSYEAVSKIRKLESQQI